MALSYRLQALQARVKKLQKESRGVETFPTSSFTFFGANEEIQRLNDPELLISGPAGTGKSFACLTRVHNACMNIPHTRALIVRKTKASMAESVLKTFEVNVLGQGHPLTLGPTRQNRKFYLYPNGSRIIVAGMDNPDRVMSSEYDVIYVCEATELHEGDWDNLSSRLRNNTADQEQVLLADCNPAAENHWLYQRVKQNKTTMLVSKHQDNPLLWNHEIGDWTEKGVSYMERLKNMGGVRYKRLYLGLWAAAEGAVYEDFDPQVHNISGRLPRFTKYIVGVDVGFRHAGVMALFGVAEDDTLILVREIYRTGQTQDWWIDQALMLQGQYRIEKFVCDPSRPDFIQALSLRLGTGNVMKANNSIKLGVDLIQQRLKKKTIRFHMDSLKEKDPVLAEAHKPLRITDEILGYLWDDKKELPIAENNDGIDAMRYCVTYHDKPMANNKPATSVSIKPFGGGKGNPKLAAQRQLAQAVTNSG